MIIFYILLLIVGFIIFVIDPWDDTSSFYDKKGKNMIKIEFKQKR